MLTANMNKHWLLDKGLMIASVHDITRALEQPKIMALCYDNGTDIGIIEKPEDIADLPESTVLYIVDRGEFSEDAHLAVATMTFVETSAFKEVQTPEYQEHLIDA